MEIGKWWWILDDLLVAWLLNMKPREFGRVKDKIEWKTYPLDKRVVNIARNRSHACCSTFSRNHRNRKKHAFWIHSIFLDYDSCEGWWHSMLSRILEQKFIFSLVNIPAHTCLNNKRIINKIQRISKNEFTTNKTTVNHQITTHKYS